MEERAHCGGHWDGITRLFAKSQAPRIFPEAARILGLYG